MTFTERGQNQSLAEHLLSNAAALGLSLDQQSRLIHAHRLSVMRWADKGREAAAQREAGRIAHAVQAEVAEALTAAVVAAKARGERVSAYNRAGARRIKSRDGLGSLVESGALTQTDDQVGMAYRLLYEQAGVGAGLGSQLEDRPRSVRDSSHGAVAAGLFRAYAGVRLTAVDRAVAEADRTGRALAVLRAVAGEGRTIRSLGGGGNTRDANLEALRRGLRIALVTLQRNGGLRIGGH